MHKYSILLFAILLLASCQDQAELSDAYGNFEAVATTVSSESNGQLLFLNVEEGQNLKAGTLVAIVDTSQLDLQRKQVQAGINTLPKKLRNTLADIEVLEKQKANLVRERNRVNRLVNKKAATTKQLDDLNGQVEVVDKQIIALRAQTKLGNTAILSEKAPLLAQIDLVNERIRKSYIHNPVDGTVLTKLSESHEVVGPGSPLYRIGQLDTMTLRFYVDAVELQSLKIGQNVQVLVDSGADQFSELTGTVEWIADQAEFTPKTIQTKQDRVNLVYAVKASVPNPDGMLKIGMPAEVNFIPKKTEQTD